MIERHKNEFGDVLRILKTTGSVPTERLNKLRHQKSIEQSNSKQSFQQQATRLEESFTIYIGWLFKRQQPTVSVTL